MNKNQWEKNFGGYYENDRDFIILSIIVMVVIGFFFREPILYVIIGGFVLFLGINIVYDRSVGNKLNLANKRARLRLFQGEQGVLSFEFENKSNLPMIHGQFRYQIESNLKSLDGAELSGETLNAFQKTFSIRSNGKTSVHFPFEGKQRGIAKVRNISYSFPHLFNFNAITLLYTPYYYTEVIVFPEPLYVEGLELAFQMAPEDHSVNLSPFEDIQNPIGTRNYDHDPFHQINWKASAKAQQLQTNVYEKVVDTSYVFIVNVRHLQNGIQVNELMEKVLSYTAFTCHYAMEANIPYELFINARTASMVPYLHLSEGEGRTHYVKSLEMLARIPRYTMTYPFAQMIHRVKKEVISPKTIVIIGETPDEAVPLLYEWTRRQKDVFHITANEDGAVMKRWNLENLALEDVRLHA